MLSFDWHGSKIPETFCTTQDTLHDPGADPPTKGRKEHQSRRTAVLWAAVSTLLAGNVAVVIWLSLVSTFVDRLPPATPSNDLNAILHSWHRPSDLNASIFTVPNNFSRGIYPIPCHSHNDYRRRVPLLQAISAGCTSIEVDVWLNGGATDILVGHSKASLRSDYTLQSLYVDPLLTILTHQNSPAPVMVTNSSVGAAGIFDTRPAASLVLLLDLKTDGRALWPVVQRQLEPLRQNGWLTFWDADIQRVSPRPVTVVASGDAPFDLVTANASYRDIFYDAPLEDVRNERYTVQTSYYASASLRRSIHYRGFGDLTGAQLRHLQQQIREASEKGLISRYWDTPRWPVSLRKDIWQLLVANGVGVLNVDEPVEASRWGWRWCHVAGSVLCGRR